VHFKEGSEVKSNALLFTIDPRPTQAALEAGARKSATRRGATWNMQKSNFRARQKLLDDQKLISQDEFDTSKAAYDALQPARWRRTRRRHQRATESGILHGFRAPFDGATGGLQFTKVMS
jgi:multidrug efflux pump subunit AcrA (membrane-fusion protein)